jgi:hypothetical protein
MHRHGPCVVIARLDRIGANLSWLGDASRLVITRFKRVIQYSAAKP